MSTHSKLSPSSANRWTECTRSVPYLAELLAAGKIKPDETSIYAEEGTQAHEWARQMMLEECTIDDVPPDFQEHVSTYVQTCQALMEQNGITFIEEQVALWYRPEDFGTVDFLSVQPPVIRDLKYGPGIIHVRDLKYGAGVLVQTEGNKQMVIYAWSAVVWLREQGIFDIADDWTVTLQIIQPRHREWIDEPWVLTVGELGALAAEIELAVALIDEGVVEFAPSEYACRWCGVKAICPARAACLESLTIDVTSDFEDLSVPDPAMLDDRQLLGILTHADAVEKFISDVREHAYNRSVEGNPVEGTKLVLGRQGNRKWSDEVEAAKALKRWKFKRDEMYEETLVSPATAEKMLKVKKLPAELLVPVTTRAPGKPVLALAGDKRAAIENVADEFEQIS